MYFFFFFFLRFQEKKYFQESYNCRIASVNLPCKLKSKERAKKPLPFNQSLYEIHGKLSKFLAEGIIAADPVLTWNNWQMSLASWLNSAEHSHCLFFLARTVEGFESIWFCQPGLGCCRWFLFVFLFFFSPPFFFLSLKKYQKTTNILLCVTAIKSAESCLETSWLL